MCMHPQQVETFAKLEFSFLTLHWLLDDCKGNSKLKVVPKFFFLIFCQAAGNERKPTENIFFSFPFGMWISLKHVCVRDFMKKKLLLTCCWEWVMDIEFFEGRKSNLKVLWNKWNFLEEEDALQFTEIFFGGGRYGCTQNSFLYPLYHAW